ncbi:MAG: undecaprenyl-diphosphate phosphatase [Opitutales bacterium]
MGRLRYTIVLGVLLTAVTLPAQPIDEVESTQVSSEADAFETTAVSPLGYDEALILGLVEGITEYLPISSTGHLLLSNKLLGLDAETVLLDDAGQPKLLAPELGVRADNVYTVKQAADAYAIVIQAGAILAVTLIYWGRIRDMILGIFGKNPAGRRLALNLVVAFLPAAFLGLLLDDWIEAQLFFPGPILFALFAGALLMFAVEAWRKRKGTSLDPEAGPDLHELSYRQCLVVGFLQCVAMWPGTSRSMMTIVGGYVVGLNPKRAAEFSFLLGLITLTAASGYKFTMPYLKGEPTLLDALDPGPVLFGILVSTVSAALAVKWLVGYLTRHGLALFAWYRIVLVVVLGGVFWFTGEF